MLRKCLSRKNGRQTVPWTVLIMKLLSLQHDHAIARCVRLSSVVSGIQASESGRLMTRLLCSCFSTANIANRRSIVIRRGVQTNAPRIGAPPRTDAPKDTCPPGQTRGRLALSRVCARSSLCTNRCDTRNMHGTGLGQSHR